MGLFDKKFCDVCGAKIGMLGNKKLEDGNLCKDCAKKLSPWFSERRHSTLEEIKAQLQYREENKEAVRNFHVTRTIGRNTKVLIDEDARKFAVTSAKNLEEANPDILDYSMVTGCRLDIDEDSYEIKRRVGENEVSYNPPRYEYSYNFRILINVNHPYFDEISFQLNSSRVNTGERRGGDGTSPEYNEHVEMADEIKNTLMNARQEARDQQAAQNAPKFAVTCKQCGATTIPDDYGRCEYCGGLAQ